MSAANPVNSIMVEFIHFVNKEDTVIPKVSFIKQSTHSTVPVCAILSCFRTGLC